MVFSLLLALAAVLVLYALGVVSLTVAGVAALIVAASLGFLIISRMVHISFLTKRAKELRAKWAGALTLIDGLPTPINQKMYLFISRRDELSLENREYTLLLPLSCIHTILLISAGALLTTSDAELAERLHFAEKPRLNLTRAWVRRHPDAVNQKLVLFWVQQDKQIEHKLGDILVFSDENVLGDLKALLRRPEVALKTTVIEEKAAKPAATFSDGVKQITEGHTEPFLVSRVKQELKKEKENDS